MCDRRTSLYIPSCFHVKYKKPPTVSCLTTLQITKYTNELQKRNWHQGACSRQWLGRPCKVNNSQVQILTRSLSSGAAVDDGARSCTEVVALMAPQESLKESKNTQEALVPLTVHRLAELTGVTLRWERQRHIVKVEGLWRMKTMTLHEHVFLGRAQGSRLQRVCSTKIAREAENNKSTPFKLYIFNRNILFCVLSLMESITCRHAVRYY